MGERLGSATELRTRRVLVGAMVTVGFLAMACQSATSARTVRSAPTTGAEWFPAETTSRQEPSHQGTPGSYVPSSPDTHPPATPETETVPTIEVVEPGTSGAYDPWRSTKRSS